MNVSRVVGRSAALLALLFFFQDSPGRAKTQNYSVDVALVFAIDGSGSIEGYEFGFQMDALANAIVQSDVIQAIKSGSNRRIAVNYVIWGDADFPSQIGIWRIIKNANDARSFSSEIKSAERRATGNTGVGAGMGDALLLLTDLPFHTDRMVIDVSGDGIETFITRRGKRKSEPIWNTSLASALARTMGVTINGLVLPSSDPNLAAWYRKNVQTGAESFVVEASSFGEVSTAMHRKLLREISSGVVARLP